MLSKYLWKVGTLRAILETLGTACALLMILLLDTHEPLTAWLAILWLAVLSVILCALRLRLGEGPLRRALAYDARIAVMLACGLGVMALVLMQVPVIASSAIAGFGGPTILFTIAVLGGMFFFLLRVLIRFVLLWNQIRRRRLLWSIVHAHLMTLLVITGIVLVFQAGSVPTETMGLLPDGWLASLAVRLLTKLTFLLMYIALLIPALVGVMALAAMMSYVVARQITRRIEALAVAAGSLRGGEYSQRITVQGEDEVAQLQTDFNAMAAHLEGTLAALKTERDTVAGLLHTRRELIAGVSHELRTPIATLRGYIESALGPWTTTPPDTLRHDMEIMEHEIIRLQALVEDLFALSRAEVGKLTLRCEATDAGAVIRRMVETTAPLAWQSGKVQIVAEIEEQVPQISADAGRLEQILRNLIHNGVRHTPPGGIIVVRAAREGPQTVRIEVRDTGEGIAPDELPHIWERYYQGKQGGQLDQGAGLGLALVKALTAAMGGTVTVESKTGQGSCFSIILPTDNGNNLV